MNLCVLCGFPLKARPMYGDQAHNNLETCIRLLKAELARLVPTRSVQGLGGLPMSLSRHTRLATEGRAGVHNFGFVHTLCTAVECGKMGMLRESTDKARLENLIGIIYNLPLCSVHSSLLVP